MQAWKKFWILASVVLLCLVWRPALGIVVNAFYDFVQIGAPSDPPSGQARLYVDSSSTLLSCILPSGSSCMPSSGGGAFIQSLTAPVSANFSQVNFNVGTGVTSTQVNGSSPVTYITIRQQDPNYTGNIAVLSKAKLASTFTVTEAITFAGDTEAGICVGIWLGDAGTNNIMFGVYQSVNNDGAFMPRIFSGTTYLARNYSNVFAPGGTGGNFGPLLWLQVQETASARIYRMSSDGATFYQVYTESNTAHLTTTRYGFGLGYFNSGGQSYDAGITDYSFTETNP